MNKAVKKIENDIAEKIYKPNIKDLNEMHKKSMEVADIALEWMVVIKDWKKVINRGMVKVSKELKYIREMVKVEKKEPTKYIEDLTPMIHVELNDKQKEVLDKFKKLKSKW